MLNADVLAAGLSDTQLDRLNHAADSRPPSVLPRLGPCTMHTSKAQLAIYLAYHELEINKTW